MPQKHNKQAIPVRASSRRSGVVTQFLSLNLYAKGSFERSITSFDPNENHNGVPLDTPRTVSAVPSQVVHTAKKRRQSTGTTASKKRAKRAVSAASSDDSGSSRAASPAPSVNVVAPPPTAASASATKRGRPRNAPAASPKTPAKRTPKSGAKAKSPKKAKATKGRRGADENEATSSSKKDRATRGDDGEAMAAVPKKAGGRARQLRQSMAAVALQIKQEPPSSDDDENNHRQALQAVSSLRTAIDAALNGNQDLTSEQIDEMVSVLHELCERGSTVNAVDYANMMDNLKMVAERIARKEGIPDVAALVHQVRGQLSAANARATAATTRATAHHTKVIELTIERDMLKQEVDQLTEQLRQNGGGRAAPSSSRSSRLGRQPPSSRGGGGGDAYDLPAGFAAASALVPVGMQPLNTAQSLSLQPAAPALAPFDVSQLPRGSTIGRSQMAGRANDLISGLSNVAGLGDTLASVAVTAATMPELDPDGNMVQRTIRTRVERIAVTDDMDVDELRRLGFAVVRLEGSDNDDDDDEGGDSARIEAIVEEEVVDDGEAMEDIEEEGDEPVVEEAE
ncbi:hypothetical protein PRIPAC_71157 [Pristionchus pacificus]|uniref:Uncharacterized protein n=1 Tax=Pristionchus pacificus TaxID=54126 RepID=A0A2A6B4Z1_PRIPA|nr:hypothetical protein PRIPAC_71157 [Pristionchus pacificus]|eukprot:PDM60923.1 hypothetical protein PRIPAC_54729 [Pristionchus pacificus]